MLLQTLSDAWQVMPLDTFQQGIYSRSDTGWMPATVPGHWQQIQGLERHTGKVVYRCRFSWDEGRRTKDEGRRSQGVRATAAGELPAPKAELPSSLAPGPSSGTRHWLRLNGVFYYSHVYLNGVDLGAHQGYFVPHEIDVSGLLQPENTLLVEVDCPEERDKLGKKMITGVFSHWDCLDPLANPGGIWLPVELHRSGPVRLQHLRLLTLACDERFAQLRFNLELDAATDGPVTIRLRFAPRTFEGEAQVFEQRRTLRRGAQEVGGLLKLRDPRLWWTHDLGRPDLYDVTVEILVDGQPSDATSITYGVRSFELRDWIAYLNGVRFLIKGNNYPPGDMRIATMTRERYEQDLALARDCHMNMLRIHAHVDHPQLYEAADAAGILIWQDFPLQWLYDHSVLPQARRQARLMAQLLGSHPSVAVWCMHNEAVVIENTSDESLLARLRTYRSAFSFNWNRDVMDTQLKQIVEQEDPTRPVIRSSGELDIPYLRKGTDAHAYFGWYRTYGTLADAEALRRRFPANMAFITEFGAQSFPNLESSLRFMPEQLAGEDIRRLEERHSLQGAILSHWVPWRDAASLADVVTISQDYQIAINRYYVDRLRAQKYHPTGGIVPFIFVDPYPAVLWSVVDYWRVPKRSYWALRLAFSPQYAFCIFAPRVYALGESVELPLSVVNDARRAFHGATLEARLRGPDGAIIAEARHRVDLPADCLPIIVDRLRLTPTRPGRYTLDLALRGVEHEMEQRYELEVE
jgi:beta-mannosidase